jgi:pectinesterase
MNKIILVLFLVLSAQRALAADAVVAADGSGDYKTVQDPINGQALAIRADGDRAVFRNCRFLGWQDTIPLNRGHHYFEDSLIAGHADFIFGAATAFFERCHIHVWRNGYITAASTPAEERYGFVFSHSRITGQSADVKTYLGRPWRDFAQLTFLSTQMSDVVRPVGWNNWDRPKRETSRYSEFGSTGPGAKPAERVSWARSLSAKDAAAITATTVLGWDPGKVPPHPSSSQLGSASESLNRLEEWIKTHGWLEK